MATPVFLPPTSYDYVTVQKVQGSETTEASDVLAAEEPLEIRVGYGPESRRQHRTLSVTMRTPGHDFELTAGFLLTEGIIRGREDLQGILYCPDVAKEEERENVVRAELSPASVPDLPRLERHFYTSSSCGVCGKTSIEAVHAASCPVLPTQGPYVATAVIHQLPAQQRAAQALFEQTGGLHAAALFSPAGELLLLREDVGRHNALDKVIGAVLLAGQLPLHGAVLLVSGRASFELVQKAAVAGIPVLAAVGAPSSLAVSAAHNFGMTLCGFVRQNRFNVYSHSWRITGEAEPTS
ncbi:formate dehydrogenase accessory sulfurtransferase FdhD [Microvirga sp. STR05]|uniref:formate dehydrogenase accessory sulfurtransferase FdhD n=1 Tax=Hymenobacter duratus TaxID=2771356 RepID=UPI001B8C0C47|nr:formate dehydrogenase accessory sulfurtransferase FdhD [Hymenobacter duratus]MBR7951997.1 formate dehydrogenase accessory sulfurtransferase FdhD [Microvirga sp. STR05]